MYPYPGLFERLKPNLDISGIEGKRNKLNFEMKSLEIKNSPLVILSAKSEFNDKVLENHLTGKLRS